MSHGCQSCGPRSGFPLARYRRFRVCWRRRRTGSAGRRRCRRRQRPVGERPVGERPGDERPGDERPVDERPVDERPGDERPVDERPVGERSVGERPGHERSGERLDGAGQSADPAVPQVSSSPARSADAAEPHVDRGRYDLHLSRPAGPRAPVGRRPRIVRRLLPALGLGVSPGPRRRGRDRSRDLDPGSEPGPASEPQGDLRSTPNARRRTSATCSSRASLASCASRRGRPRTSGSAETLSPTAR